MFFGRESVDELLPGPLGWPSSLEWMDSVLSVEACER